MNLSAEAGQAARHVQDDIEGLRRATGRQRDRGIEDMAKLGAELTRKRAAFSQARDELERRIAEIDLSLRPILDLFAELEGWARDESQ